MKRPSEKAFGSLLSIGLWLTIGGFFVGGLCLFLGFLPLGRSFQTILMGLGGLFLLCFVGGLISLVITLASGLQAGKGASKKVVQVNNAKVIARYGLNSAGEMLFDQTYMDPADPKLKLYVRLEVPGAGTHEYRCNGVVWGNCGESMVGTAMIQGDWIGQFVATIGLPRGQTYQGDVARP